MKKFLMTVVMLVMILPTFGQKLNSRGEKMVSSIYKYHFNKGKMYVETIYDFEYDKNGVLLSVTYTHPQCKTTTIIKRKDNTLFREDWEDGVKDTHHPTEYTLNEKGFIISEKSGNWVDTSVLDYAYDLSEFEYTYIGELNRYSLCKYSGCKWEKRKGGQPFLCNGECGITYFINTSEGIQYTCALNNKGDEYRESISCLTYGDNINDTNINLFALISTCGVRNNLFVTEWIPFYMKRLPINLLNCAREYASSTYDYFYYDGNIVCIQLNLASGKTNMVAKINYVEEDDDE